MQRAYRNQPQSCRPLAANGIRFRNTPFLRGGVLRVWRIGRNSWGFFKIAPGGGDDYYEVWHSAAAAFFGAWICGARGTPGSAVVAIGAKDGAGADSRIGKRRRVQRGRCAKQPGNEFARARHRPY